VETSVPKFLGIFPEFSTNQNFWGCAFIPCTPAPTLLQQVNENDVQKAGAARSTAPGYSTVRRLSAAHLLLRKHSTQEFESGIVRPWQRHSW